MKEAFVIHHPTIFEIKAHFDKRKKAELDPVGDLLFEECTLADLVYLTSLTAEELDAMRPSEIQLIIDEVREANPQFFAMTARARSTLSDIFARLIKDLNLDS